MLVFHLIVVLTNVETVVKLATRAGLANRSVHPPNSRRFSAINAMRKAIEFGIVPKSVSNVAVVLARSAKVKIILPR